MIIQLDTTSDTPIYLQLRNEIVMGVGRGDLKIGDPLPTVRQMAVDIGVNSMTVNKAYALLKQEGFIDIDRRHGAVVSPRADTSGAFCGRVEAELKLLVAESALKGMEKQDFLARVNAMFDDLHISAATGNA